MYDDGLDPDAPFEDDVWELYHVAEDFSECDDLAAQEPERLAALVDLWWEEARKYQVLPLDNRPIAALLAPRRPFDDRDRYVFWPSAQPIPENVTRQRARTATTRSPPTVEIPEVGSGRGRAARDGDGARRLVVPPRSTDGCGTCTTSSARSATPSRPTSSCRPGAHELGVLVHEPRRLQRDRPAARRRRRRRRGEIATTTPVRYSISGAGLTCGWEQGPPVGDGYAAPFRFTGTLHRVVVEVDGVGHRDPEAEFEAIMAEQ